VFSESPLARGYADIVEEMKERIKRDPEKLAMRKKIVEHTSLGARH